MFEFGGVVYVSMLPRQSLEVKRSFTAFGSSCAPDVRHTCRVNYNVHRTSW